MLDVIKKKEMRGLLVSFLIIVLSVFLILRPDQMIETLIRVIGLFVLVCGVFDFTNYFIKKDDSKMIDMGLSKGIMEICIGVLFLFKYHVLLEVFPMLLGLLIVFINVFKLQLSLNLKEVDSSNYLTGVAIASLSIVFGIIILLNPFDSLKVVVIVSGAVLLLSELANIIYSILVLRGFKKNNNVVKDIAIREE